MKKLFIILLMSLFALMSVNAADYTGFNFLIQPEDSSPKGLTWMDNESVYWVAGGSNEFLFQYAETGSYNSKSFDISGTTGNLQDVAYCFGSLWVADITTNTIYEYSTAGTYLSNSIDVSSQETALTGVTCDNTYFYIVGQTNDAVYKYNQAGTYQASSFSVSAQETGPTGLTWDGEFFWVIGGNDKAYKYNAAGSYQTEFIDGSSQETTSGGITYRNSEGTFVITGAASDRAHEYVVDAKAPFATDIVSFYNFTTDGSDQIASNDITGSSTVTNGYLDMDRASTANIYSGSVTENFGDVTVMMQINPDDNTNDGFFNLGTTTDAYGMDLFSASGTGALRVFTNADGTCTIPETYTASAWNHIAVTVNTTTNIAKYYLNGEYITNCDHTTDLTAVNRFTVGGQKFDNDPFDGQIDNVSIFSRYLTSEEIYGASQFGLNFSVPGPSGSTPTINHDVASFYNTSSITINLNTSITTNMSYSLDGGAETVIGEFNLTTLVLSSLTDSLHNISLISNNSFGQVSSFATFTIDTTYPVIGNTLGAQYTSYDIDWTSYITITETNPTSCNIAFNGGASTTCSDASYTFLNNGNVTYNITAIDDAGNQISSNNNVVLVNPDVTLHISSSGSPLTGFTLAGRSDTAGTVVFSVYGDGLTQGSNSLEFQKLGYATQTFALTLDTTSDINRTYNVSQAEIQLSIKDKVTGVLLTTTNFSVSFIATVGLETTTTTGTVNVTNVLFLNEDYRVLVSNPLYETESIYFNFSNQETLILDIFMLNSSNPEVGLIFIKVVDKDEKPIEGATIQALQWDTTISDYVKVSESKTGGDGLGSLNIILNDEIYQFTASSDGAMKTTNDGDGVISTVEDGKTIIMSLGGGIVSQTYLLQDLLYTINESFNNITNVSTVEISWQDLNGLPRIICINQYRILASTSTQTNENCGISDDAGTLVQAYFINNTFNTELKVEVKEGSNYLAPPLEVFPFEPLGSIPSVLRDIGIYIFVMPFLFLLSMALGIWAEKPFIGYIGLGVSALVSIIAVPTLINTGIVAFLGFLCYIGISYGVREQ